MDFERELTYTPPVMTNVAELLSRAEFPRSGRYDPDWIIDGQMGPNALWLAEWLSTAVELRPDMRVLDLGCGKAITSVFWAREFDLHVYAADLWTSVDDNWRRVKAAGEQHRVTPIHAEAHALPFGAGYFDAIVSVDAYQYFGTDVLYLHYLSRFLRPGGSLGLVVPGLMQPLPEAGVPAHLAEPQRNGKVFWEEECICFQTAQWWKSLAAQCSRVEVTHADTLENGWQHWRDFERAVELSGKGLFPSDAEALDQDAGRYLGFVRLVARRTDADGMNLYDPVLGARVEAQARDE
jgi:ubiquinone/menaquinone biosynthesis C-methylase UbiE